MQRAEAKFIKSYKYKRKRNEDGEIIEAASCDQIKNPRQKGEAVKQVKSAARSALALPKMLPKNSSSRAYSACKSEHKARRRKKPSNSVRKTTTLQFINLISTSLLILVDLHSLVDAFCPSTKCHCDNQLLSANCTQVPTITIIPMTMNPLLKRLTLNHLPVVELSNSLSVYRQLESLDLSSNQLRQIKYENFNFKPRPSNSITLTNHNNLPSSNQLELANHNNQLLARHLKQSIDKSLASGEDEIRFHLRELVLSDNRIEQLGGLNEEDNLSATGLSSDLPEIDSIEESSQSTKGNRRLRSLDLQRLAPFLTLTKLETLNLSGNKLARIHQHVFLGLVHLKQLDLSHNRLEIIDRYALVGLVELEQLYLANNRLARHLPTLSLALCRAPMNELRELDLSDNGRLISTPQDQQILLPNQMFICAPKVQYLRLDGNQLRYIQANAFDNLQQLQVLNLSRNHLEQVPSDSLCSYSNSNLSQTLTYLDLSENLIEFVNANSFSWLKNLQRLQMNSMPRLVSFDLASLSFVHLIGERASEEPAMMMMINSQLVHELINSQLIELHLRDNPRLQALHSSLTSRGEHPKGRMKFKKLRLLDLNGASELREFPLDQMMDLSELQEVLLLDLSQTSKLNCSSCHLSWLIDAARASWPQSLQKIPSQVDRWQPAQQQQQFLSHSAGKVMLLTSGVGCAWPFVMPLGQLLELETSYAPIFPGYAQCSGAQLLSASRAPEQKVAWRPIEPTDERHVGAKQSADWVETEQNKPQRQQDRQEPDFPLLLATGALLCLVLVAVCARQLITSTWYLKKRRHGYGSPAINNSAPAGGFKWRHSTSLANTDTTSAANGCSPTTSLESPSSSNSNSASSDHRRRQQTNGSSNGLVVSGFSEKQASARLLAAGWPVGGFTNGLPMERGQVAMVSLQRANLFSRIVGRLSATFGIARGHHQSYPTIQASVGRQQFCARSTTRKPVANNIIENVVYGGDKILVSSANEQPTLPMRFGGDQATGYLIASSEYANCDQHQGTSCSSPISRNNAQGAAGERQLLMERTSCANRLLMQPSLAVVNNLQALQEHRNSSTCNYQATRSVNNKSHSQLRQRQQQQHLEKEPIDHYRLYSAAITPGGGFAPGQLSERDNGLGIEGHIYVTLDGPIKQLGYANGAAPQQGGSNQSADWPAQVGEGHKSFEWAAENNKQPLSCPSSSSSAEDKFKLVQSGGKLSGAGFEGKPAEQQARYGHAANGQMKIYDGCDFQELSGSLLPLERAASGHSKRPASKKKRERAGRVSPVLTEPGANGCNVTGQSDYRAGSSAHRELQNQLLLYPHGGSGCQSASAASSDLLQQQQPLANSGKYDANHGFRIAAAAANGSSRNAAPAPKDDYVINGSSCSGGAMHRSPESQPPSDFAAKAVGVASGFGEEPKAWNNASPMINEALANAESMITPQRHLIGQQNGSDFVVAQNWQKQSSDCDYLATNQQCDRMTNVGAGNRNSLANEIYSNQFYYCKPSRSDATFSATLSRIKSKSSSVQQPSGDQKAQDSG